MVRKSGMRAKSNFERFLRRMISFWGSSKSRRYCRVRDGVKYIFSDIMRSFSGKTGYCIDWAILILFEPKILGDQGTCGLVWLIADCSLENGLRKVESVRLQSYDIVRSRIKMDCKINLGLKAHMTFQNGFLANQAARQKQTRGVCSSGPLELRWRWSCRNRIYWMETIKSRLIQITFCWEWMSPYNLQTCRVDV